jgi:hypothetical protein
MVLGNARRAPVADMLRTVQSMTLRRLLKMIWAPFRVRLRSALRLLLIRMSKPLIPFFRVNTLAALFYEPRLLPKRRARIPSTPVLGSIPITEPRNLVSPRVRGFFFGAVSCQAAEACLGPALTPQRDNLLRRKRRGS